MSTAFLPQAQQQNSVKQPTTGELLRIIRERLGWSQRNMAKALAIALDTYSQYERDVVSIRTNPLQGGKMVLLAAQQLYLVWLGIQFWEVFHGYQERVYQEGEGESTKHVITGQQRIL